MVLNPDFIGKTYPASDPYLVGREKIREFAVAIGDPNPVFRDVAAAQALGYPDLVAPPTFAIALSMEASMDAVRDPELGLDYSRVVHGEQRFTYARPIVAGDEIVTTVVIDNVRSMAGNDFVTTTAHLSTPAGEQVATATALIVSRGEDPA